MDDVRYRFGCGSGRENHNATFHPEVIKAKLRQLPAAYSFTESALLLLAAL